jgi:hypothetical protein
MLAETFPYVSVLADRISTPRYGSVAFPGFGVRLIVRTPEATAAFCVENWASFPAYVNVSSCHADRSSVLKSSSHDRTNEPVDPSLPASVPFAAPPSPPPSPAATVPEVADDAERSELADDVPAADEDAPVELACPDDPEAVVDPGRLDEPTASDVLESLAPCDSDVFDRLDVPAHPAISAVAATPAIRRARGPAIPSLAAAAHRKPARIARVAMRRR